MSVFIILITASLIVASGFLIAFFWAVKTNQYDDDYTPSVRILFENPINPIESKKNRTLPDNTSDNMNAKLNSTL